MPAFIPCNYLVFRLGGDLIKFGTWTSAETMLRSRYVTHYGKNIQLLIFRVGSKDVAIRNEKLFLLKFASYHDSYELFNMAGLGDMIAFVQDITTHTPVLHHLVDRTWFPLTCTRYCGRRENEQILDRKRRADPQRLNKHNGQKHAVILNFRGDSPSDDMIQKYQLAWDDELEKWICCLPAIPKLQHQIHADPQ